MRKGTPLASRVAQGVSGPSSSCVWNPRVFADDARGWQCPFVSGPAWCPLPELGPGFPGHPRPALATGIKVFLPPIAASQLLPSH